MSEIFDGTVDIQDGSGNTTVFLTGNDGQVFVGGAGQDGRVDVLDAAGVARIFLHADGSFVSRDAAAVSIVTVTGDGQIFIQRQLGADYFPVFQFLSPQASLAIGGERTSGSFKLLNSDGQDTVELDGSGDLTIRQDIGGTLRDVMKFVAGTANLHIGSEDNEGDLFVRDGEGRSAVHVDGNRAAMFVGVEGNEGDLIIRDGHGRQVVHLGGDKAVVDVGTEGNEGDVRVFDADGDLRIHLDGASGQVNTLGADCAEDFTVRGGEAIEPGTVLVIEDSGRLRESTDAYDRRVAGVVSGGGSFGPGIVLDKQQSGTDRRPVALIGKACCKVDADCGAVAVGDLLTTAATPGYAMKAADPQRAFGAVIGKALAPLARGRGLVPILVALQ